MITGSVEFEMITGSVEFEIDSTMNGIDVELITITSFVESCITSSKEISSAYAVPQ